MKKVTEVQKKKIIEAFVEGNTIKEISNSYQFTVNTITRQLKQILGEKQFEKIKSSNSSKTNKDKKNLITNNSKLSEDNLKPQKFKNEIKEINNDSDNQENCFYEIKPLTEGIELEKQKDISSQPLKDIKFPNMVYILIEKEIEIKPRLLYDYPEWRFLPKEDLERYAIQIFQDQKEAKRHCNKNQKLLKVPNPNVFLIASQKMKSKGISRLVFGEKLISL